MNDTSLDPATHHPRLDEIIDELHACREELLQAVASAPESLHQARATEGKWTLAQVLEHLWLAENGSGRLVTKLIREAQDNGHVETEQSSLLNTLDHHNVANPKQRMRAPEMIRPTEGMSVETALTRLRESRERLLKSLQAARGLALGKVSAPHPALGPLDAYRWLLFLAQHERRHARQIREMSRPETRA